MPTPSRRGIGLGLSALLAPMLAAQDRYDQDKMHANFAAMQKSDWFEKGGWTTDFAAAKARSRTTGKPILAYFTRTYSP